jgi:hypothetical protein
MQKLFKSNRRYAELVGSSPIHFSVKNYGFFMTPEEWRQIPILNAQPSVGEGQYLNLIMLEVNGQLRRQWVVEEVPPEEEV